MPVLRRFLIASAFARLLRRVFQPEQVIEGYFSPQDDRQSYVRLVNGQAHLLLVSLGAGLEASTGLPRGHAEALLEVCPATLTFERLTVLIAGHTALVDRITSPGLLDVVSVEFTSPNDAAAFVSPAWFGPEVTPDEGFMNRAMAVSGLPSAVETETSNSGLEALLDFIEGDGLGRAMQPVADANGEVALPSRASNVDQSLPRISAVELPSERATGDVDSRPPVSKTFPSKPGSEGDRLAGVIEGLSAALNTAGHGEQPDAARPRRWSLGNP